MTVTIRTATSADLSGVDALLARAYPRLLKPDYPPSVRVTALPLISRAQPALVRSGTYHVAVDPKGDIVGAGGWTRDRREGATGHVRHVVTDDRATRQGIGRSILLHVFTQAKDRGIRRLLCQSTLTAQPFYAALGFATRGKMDVELRPGIVFPVIAMERLLT